MLFPDTRRLLPVGVAVGVAALAGWGLRALARSRRRVGPLGRPGALAWSQLHADAASQGSRFVPSEFALSPRWTVVVGRQVVASPVIGPDGTIYVTTLDGELVAVSPDGIIRWRATFGMPIPSSPAVDEDGRIYVVPTSVFPDQTRRSAFAVVAPSGVVLRLRLLPDQAFTSASPTVWRDDGQTRVALYARLPLRVANRLDSAVLVFDRDGELVARQNLFCSLGPITGGSSIFDAIWDFLTPSGTIGDAPGPPEGTLQPAPPLHERVGWLDPTPAVVDGADLTPPRSRPIVVVVNPPCRIVALSWNPPQFDEIWSVSHEQLVASSPAVLNSGSVVVVGTREGTVLAYHPQTGDRLWSVPTRGGEQVRGTPASLGGLIYVASIRHVQALEPATGAAVFEAGLGEVTVASPSLSGSHIYVNTARGFVSMSLDLQLRAEDGLLRGERSSPAVAEDGTVYTVGGRGVSLLRAYGRSGGGRAIARRFDD